MSENPLIEMLRAKVTGTPWNRLVIIDNRKTRMREFYRINGETWSRYVDDDNIREALFGTFPDHPDNQRRDSEE